MDNLSKIKNDIWFILEANIVPDISNESGKKREYLINGIKIQNYWDMIAILDMSTDNYEEIKNKLILSLFRKYLRENIVNIKNSSQIKSLFQYDIEL